MPALKHHAIGSCVEEERKRNMQLMKRHTETRSVGFGAASSTSSKHFLWKKERWVRTAIEIVVNRWDRRPTYSPTHTAHTQTHICLHLQTDDHTQSPVAIVSCADTLFLAAVHYVKCQCDLKLHVWQQYECTINTHNGSPWEKLRLTCYIGLIY